MQGGDFTGGNLTEGVNAPISSTGSCNGHWSVKDFLKGFLECELDGWIGILALPTKEVFSAVGEKETVRNRLHPGINACRLGARDRRSSSEAGKATVSVHPFVAGRGVSVRDVLEGSFDIKTEVIVDEEFQTA